MKSTTAWRDFGLPRIADTPPALRIPVPPTLPRQPDEARALDALADALGVGDGRPRVVTTPNGVSVAIRRELLRHTVRGAATPHRALQAVSRLRLASRAPVPTPPRPTAGNSRTS